MKKWMLLLWWLTQSIYAANICHGKMVDASNIDWQGMLPITIGSDTVEGGDLPDTQNPSNPICECPGTPLPHVGVALGYWEPMGLVDVTRTPYCLVNMGGKQLKKNDKAEGEVDDQSEGGGYYYVHYYNFPAMQLIGSPLLGGACQVDGTFQLTYVSELDPTWTKGVNGKTAEELAEIAFPETLLFTNQTVALNAQESCALDSAAANKNLPLNAMFWCAGSQGFMYPLTGRVVEEVSPAQATTLLSERTVFKLHRLGQIMDTNKENLCGEDIEVMMPKNRYRYQMIYPVVKPAEPFGRTTSIWEAKAFDAAKGDDAGYLIWRKRNCCHY